MNHVTLIGRLGHAPELSHTTGGTPVCEFDLAVDSAERDEPDWFRIVTFAKLAETIAEHKHSGDQVAVVGELRNHRWERDGQKRSWVKVHAARVEFLARAHQPN